MADDHEAIETRQSFIRKAVPYYAIAIAEGLVEFQSKQQLNRLSEHDLRSMWTVSVRPDSDDRVTILKDGELFARAITHCALIGLIDLLTDDFGPDYYVIRENFYDEWEHFKRTEKLYRKFNVAGSGWLIDAIAAINRIDYSDFPAEAAAADAAPVAQEIIEKYDWEPLPLDRSDPNLAKVEDALDRAIEAVRTDNGYSATHPGERQYVLGTLTSFRDALKRETQITVGWVKLCALDPLGRAIQRLGNSASGMLLSVAKDALKEWLKGLGKDLFS